MNKSFAIDCHFGCKKSALSSDQTLLPRQGQNAFSTQLSLPMSGSLHYLLSIKR